MIRIVFIYLSLLTYLLRNPHLRFDNVLLNSVTAGEAWRKSSSTLLVVGVAGTGGFSITTGSV
jgi:hypothetical protein